MKFEKQGPQIEASLYFVINCCLLKGFFLLVHFLQLSFTIQLKACVASKVI